MEIKVNNTPTTNKNNKVALYIRANNVDGVVRQLFYAIPYIIKNGLELPTSHVYADLCSANQFQRPAFDRMLREKRDKRYKTVMVSDMSRLARNPESLLMANMQLTMSGLTLKVMN